MGFREQREQIRLPELCCCGTKSSQTLLALLDPFLRLCLVRQCPGTQDRTVGPPVRKSLVRGEADSGFGILLGGLPRAAQLMEPGSQAQGETQAQRVRNLLCERHRLVTLREPPLRIAQTP